MIEVVLAYIIVFFLLRYSRKNVTFRLNFAHYLISVYKEDLGSQL